MPKAISLRFSDNSKFVLGVEIKASGWYKKFLDYWKNNHTLEKYQFNNEDLVILSVEQYEVCPDEDDVRSPWGPIDEEANLRGRLYSALVFIESPNPQ